MKLEEFAAQRREQLTVGDDALRPLVRDALSALARGEEDWSAAAVSTAGQIWLENFEAEAPGANYMAALQRFRRKLSEVLALTGAPEGEASQGQIERIVKWVSTYAVNSGTVQGTYAAGGRYKMWVDMSDPDVRASHSAVDGQVVPIGSTWTVEGVKMGYPGEPVGPPSAWINCRCVAMRAGRTGDVMSATTFQLDDSQVVDEPVETPDGDDDISREGALIVLLPAADDPVVAATSEDVAHMTTVWFGNTSDLTVDLEELEQAVRLYAQDLDGPIVVPVKERGLLGDDDADVVFLEPTDSLAAARDGMLANEPIRTAHDAVEQYPEWTPHVTLGYPEGVEGGPAIGEYDATEVTFDRVGLWIAGEKYEYPMGGTVDTVTADAAAVIGEADDELVEDAPVDDDELEDGEEIVTEIPVHGVLAPEGVETGDGRGFRPGALSSRPITPTRGLPLRLEIVGSHGGNQTSEAVTVGRIDEVWRDEASSTMRFRGAIILSKAHSQEAIEGIIDGSGTGVSIDVDSMSVDMESFSEEAVMAAESAGRKPTTWFSESRVSGLTIVPIGAFHEAYFALGDEFEEDMSDEDRAAADEALVACGCAPSALELEKLSLEPGGEAFAPGTKDGPGWVTNPVATSRIRRYWVRGEGAAKIKWGAGGDFNRCRAQLAKYVQNPDWLAGLCANMHKEALGIWPGQHAGGAHALAASAAAGAEPAPMMTLVAAATTQSVYPSEWFANPRFSKKMGLRIDKATRRIFGHLAHWDSCHTGITGVCQRPPRSRSNYASFLKGVVDTDAGEQAIGTLTYGIGHASPALRAAAASAHYDRTDAVRAYVNIGEDKFGIWYSGVIPAYVTDEQIDDMRAIGALSGDWRRVGQWGLDLVAAVAVNTPGFPVPVLVASGGYQDTYIMSSEVEPEVITASAADIEENKRYLDELIERKIRERDFRARALTMRTEQFRARMNQEA